MRHVATLRMPLLLWLACIALPGLTAAKAPEDASPQSRLAAAEQLQAQGKRRAALQTLEALTEGMPAAADEVTAAAAAAALGKAHFLAGEREPARRHLESALGIARRNAVPALESAILNDLGQLDLIEERPEQALAAFETARRAAERAGGPLLFARAAINTVRAMSAAGGPGQNALLREARERLATAPDSTDKAYLLIAIGNLHQRHADDAGAQESAYRALSEAGKIAADIKDARAESFALGHLGELYAAGGRDIEALRLTRRALFLAQLANAPDALYRWHWQLARAQVAASQPEEAMASYQRAIDNLQGIRSDLMADLRVIRASYRDAVGPLFQEYADLLLRRAAAAQQGPQRGAWLVKARDTLEQLKTVELEDYFQDECVASLQARKKTIDALPAGTAVLYPVLLPDRVEMLISLPGEIRQVRLDVDGRTLGGEILAFRRMLEKRTTHQYLPHAQKLHDWLIRPIEKELAGAGTHTLVIIPDGPLRGIPLAALHDGKRFLIERYAIAVAPGLTLVEEAVATDVRRGTLMGGITESVQNFPALPFVGPEIQAIQDIYGGKSLKDGEFMIPRFEEELRNASYSVVHIASHGQIDSDPRKSFLLAYDGRITMDRLEGYMKFSRFKEDTVDLLTLSACRTAAGDDRAALGLAGMAVKAGARSALATLWYVSDQASSMLVMDFYRELAAGGKTKATALQAAQRMLLADLRYRHPGYWSPFLLIGNWQ